MKLILTNDELMAMLASALAESGINKVSDIELDMGEGTVLPISAVEGVIVHLGAK